MTTAPLSQPCIHDNGPAVDGYDECWPCLQRRAAETMDNLDFELVSWSPASRVDGESWAIARTLPSGRRVAVDVYGATVRFGEASPARVNWPSIGSVSAEDAAAFGVLLVDASGFAEHVVRGIALVH